ncbi:esterase FE4 [Temnothorax americanus]|uniref:esterase FE4 n=1 Tax=Temnothorax americanus TaxID=1964332 RepID=UPI004067D269
MRCAMSTLRLWLDTRIFWQCMCVLVSLLVLADGLFIESKELLVNTKWGFVRGKWTKTVRDRRVASFLGIPYALPPLGELRFRSPQRWNRMWTTIRDATVDGSQCMQLSREGKVVGSEDCLYLNVYVPYISDRQQKSKNLPVLVFVHPGGFARGNSNSKLYGMDYLVDQDIILVTMNYRLSALGFFSTTNQVSPGNYGVKDIKIALEWIQENIHNFEGDPKSVTLMGQSAGSAATHILALSNKTEGLFNRYILQSGSALSTWSVHPRKRYRRVCLKLAKLVGCQLEKKDNDVIASNETTTESPKEEDVSTSAYGDISDYEVKDDEEIMRCMRMADARRVVNMTQHFTVWRNHPRYNFGPTLEDDSEDAILTMHPLKIVKNGLFRDIPAIFQVVKDEGLVKSIELFTNAMVEDELTKNFEEYSLYFMENHEAIINRSAFISALQDFYFNGNVSGISDRQRRIDNITEMMGDGALTWPMFQALQYQSRIGNSSIYFSYFTYEGTFSNTFNLDTSKYYGVDHGDDLNYLFPILNNKYHNLLLHNTENDITMINILTEMWTSFVIKGIPKAWMIPAWPSYHDHHEFMRFGIDKSPETVVETDFLSNRMEFWEKLMPNESTESMNDVFVSEPEEDVPTSNAINRRLSVQFASLAIIYFYI